MITDLALLEIKDGAFHLLERAPGVSVDEIKAKTQGRLIIRKHTSEMTLL